MNNSTTAESQLLPNEPEPIMADHIHPQRGPHNIQRSLSGNNVPTKPIIHIAPPGPGGVIFNNDDYNFGSPRKKTHKKSPSMYKDIDSVFSPNGGGPRQTAAESKSQRDPADVTTNGSASNDMGRPSTAPIAGERPHVAAPSTASNPAAFSKVNSESESSSGSGSTVRNSSINRRDDSAAAAAATIRARNKQRRTSVRKPNALSFLDSDSPDPNLEGLRQSIETDAHAHGNAHAHAHDSSPLSPQSTSPSNRSASSATSGFRDDESDLVVEDGETDRSTSPERSIVSGSFEGKDFMRTPVAAARIDTGTMRRGRQRSYGPPPPDMPPYPTGLNHQQPQQPYMSPNNATTPRALNQGPFTFPPPPRADRMPLTGYELIASRFCAATAATSPLDHNHHSNEQPPPLKPIYRRFEALHHRLLLQFQDEICELEEQLHRLDSADMQSRQRLQGCIPASRRAEQQSGNEMHWHRIGILSNIGFKLEQYNNILSSFRKTQFFPTPSLADINDYRSFLATSMPIVESETRFLDATDDLICVNAEEEEEEEEEEESDDDGADSSDEEDTPATPMMPMSVPNAQFNLRGGGGSSQHSGAGPSPSPGSPSPFRPPPPYPQTENPDQQQEQQYVEKNHHEDWHHNLNNAHTPVHGHGPHQQTTPPLLLSLALGITGAILLPVLAFAAIPGFVGRLAVVFVVLVGVVGALFHQHQQGELVGGGFGGGLGVYVR
ncbi:hypothetical protein SLS62_004631 [Diatrype stigma]|uniref:DUF6594 domain-containing protein n=1 Tax=Diatrype stigma TaxID=117547 RepID=A0AAN9USV4_9PEZI